MRSPFRFALAPGALAALALSVLGGCSYSMNEYHAAGYAPITRTQGPPRPARPIVAEGEQFVVLGITQNTDYVDKAYAVLLNECDGDIVGVNTRYSSSLGFLSYTNKIRMEALCIPR